jgi:TonB family protein
MKEKNKTYTAAEIARYHAGTMPAGEMYALEKVALEDPFLADALEGYVHAPESEIDIAELRDRLTEKRKKKKVFFLSAFEGNGWWRIAVLFIIVAGAGYFFYRVNYVNKENSLVKNEIKAPAEKEDSAAPIKKDTLATDSNVAYENQQASTFKQKEKTIFLSTKPQIKREPPVPVQVPLAAAPASVSRSKDGSYADSTYREAAKKEYDAQAAAEYVLKGKVTDEEGNAVPFASITDKSRNKVTVTDTAGHFFLRSQDSSITAMASAAGYWSKSFTLKKDVQSTVEINKKDADLNDVTVTAMGKRKQAKEAASVSKALNGKVAGLQIASAGPKPSGGLEKFYQYLKKNTEPIYNEYQERLKGEVLLSFTINKKGRPENIKVVKSSCAACEKEAIKLLQNGPRWIGKKDEQGTVDIKF